LFVLTGVGCIVMGVSSWILPLFGLQWRKLINPYFDARLVGSGVAAMGALIVFYVTVLRGRVLRLIHAAGALALVVIAGALVVIAGVLVWAVVTRGGWSRPMPQPPWAGGPNAGSQAEGYGAKPGATEHPTYESLVARFGAQRVARIKLTGAKDPKFSAMVRRRIAAAFVGETKASWFMSVHNGEGELVVAPVDDLAALVRTLDLGDVSAIDRLTCTAKIAVDAEKVKGGGP
jgi:hypothetical protein